MAPPANIQGPPNQWEIVLKSKKSNFLVTAYEASSWPFFITEQEWLKLLTDNGLCVCPQERGGFLRG
jgi:hypothetical protein